MRHYQTRISVLSKFNWLNFKGALNELNEKCCSLLLLFRLTSQCARTQCHLLTLSVNTDTLLTAKADAATRNISSALRVLTSPLFLVPTY